MKIVLWAAGMLISAAVMFGCQEQEQRRAGEPVPVFQEFTGQQGPFPDRGFFVIQRPEAWQALWAGRQAPTVDFTRNTVLVALMGQQPTAGYTIAISDVRATGTEIIAYVEEMRPRPEDQVAQVITYPFHMVVAPRLTQSVAFRIEGAVRQPIAVQEMYMGQQSMAANPQTQVIRDAAAWRTFWASTFGPTAQAPEIDFNRYMASAVLLGRKPTAGYSVFITGATDVDTRIEVQYRAVAPRPGETVAQVITSPYSIAILPASIQAVAFRPVTTTTVATQ